MKNLFLTALFAATTIGAYAQMFEGKVTYGIEYVALPAQMKGMEAMLPEEMSTSLKGDMVRVEQNMAMGMKQITLVNNKTNKVNMLLDMMGRKMNVEMTADDLDKKEKKAKPEIKYMDGTKTIAGYVCKKAEVTYDQAANPVTIYYTEELPAKASREFKGLKGYPLEYEISQQGMTMRMSAKKVEKATLPASDFEVPAGFEKMTMDQLTKMMGG
jgi:GLPGLI family protein